MLCNYIVLTVVAGCDAYLTPPSCTFKTSIACRVYLIAVLLWPLVARASELGNDLQ